MITSSVLVAGGLLWHWQPEAFNSSWFLSQVAAVKSRLRRMTAAHHPAPTRVPPGGGGGHGGHGPPRPDGGVTVPTVPSY